ncbi:hypothetical protein [Porphyromonas sp.]
MKKAQMLREPYVPPTVELFFVHCCVDMLEGFSKEDLDGDIEAGPDLTPRDEDLFPDLL